MAKQSRQADRLVERVLDNPTDEALLEELGAVQQKGLKEYRNARVHKSRLKTLEKEGLE